MITKVSMLKLDSSMCLGRESLAKEETSLLTCTLPLYIASSKKYGFIRRAHKYVLIGDVLFM